MGGYALENFLIKKEGWPENAYLLHRLSKMPQDFLRKQNHRGSARQIFLTLIVEKPLKK